MYFRTDTDFYNEQENPTPIETEPELELEAIHASAKKGFLPPYFILLFIALLNCAMFVSSLLGDPISLLAKPSNLFSGFAFFVLLFLCAMELISYFIWMSKAKKAIAYGDLLPAPDTSRCQKGVLIAIFIGFFYWIITFIVCGDSLQRWVGIMVFIYIPLLIFLVNRMKQFLKRKKVSRGINRTITILTSFVGSFVLMGIIT